MKKAVILFCCILIILTSCNFDPYSDKRPTDYGDALWVCDKYNIWFVVDSGNKDYYDPEGELQNKDTTYFCKFYFISQTNQLHISVYPLEYATVPDISRDRNAVIGNIKGKCSFSDESFVLTIDTISGNILDETAKELIFRKAEIPLE